MVATSFCVHQRMPGDCPDCDDELVKGFGGGGPSKGGVNREFQIQERPFDPPPMGGYAPEQATTAVYEKPTLTDISLRCALHWRDDGSYETWCGRRLTHIEAHAMPEVGTLCSDCWEAMPATLRSDQPVVDRLEAAVAAIKIEDGDLVIVKLKTHQPVSIRRRIVDGLQRVITDEMGVNAKVILADVGIDIGVVKKAELGDLHQRIDDLEAKLDQLALDMGQ